MMSNANEPFREFYTQSHNLPGRAMAAHPRQHRIVRLLERDNTQTGTMDYLKTKLCGGKHSGRESVADGRRYAAFSGFLLAGRGCSLGSAARNY